MQLLKKITLLSLLFVSTFSNAQEVQEYNESKLLSKIDSILSLFPEKTRSYGNAFDQHRKSFIQNGHLFLCYTESEQDQNFIKYYWILEIDLGKIQFLCDEFATYNYCIIAANPSFNPFCLHSKEASNKKNKHYEYLSSTFDDMSGFSACEYVNYSNWVSYFSYPFDRENLNFTNDIEIELMSCLKSLAEHYGGGKKIRTPLPALDNQTEFFGIKKESFKSDFSAYLSDYYFTKVGKDIYRCLDKERYKLPVVFGAEPIEDICFSFDDSERLKGIYILLKEYPELINNINK